MQGWPRTLEDKNYPPSFLPLSYLCILCPLTEIKYPCSFGRAMWTCGHACATRGEDFRDWQFANMFPIPYDPEHHSIGPFSFCPLYFVRHGGKVSAKTERIECQAIARAHDLVVCPMGSLAVYMFARHYL